MQVFPYLFVMISLKSFMDAEIQGDFVIWAQRKNPDKVPGFPTILTKTLIQTIFFRTVICSYSPSFRRLLF